MTSMGRRTEQRSWAWTRGEVVAWVAMGFVLDVVVALFLGNAWWVQSVVGVGAVLVSTVPVLAHRRKRLGS